MNVVWAVLIIIVHDRHRGDRDAHGTSAGARGGYFDDGDRAAGVFGVMATGFSVLLGFLIFLAFEGPDGRGRAPRQRR